MSSEPSLLREVRACTLCTDDLPLGPRPVLQYAPAARILIAGQAPGRRVHESGVPFDDPSGDRLRDWLGLDREQFYDPELVAIVPMGFCFPGTGSSGDLPPRPECAATWRARLLGGLTRLELTVILGQYALGWHRPDHRGTLTDAVQGWREHWPSSIALPHPSPRNNRWLKKNPWFAEAVLPQLRTRTAEIVSAP